jgi:hypothetical protein
VEGSGSGSSPVAGFGVNGDKPSGSVTRELISKMDLRETGCEDGKWMKLAQDRVEYWALDLPFLLPYCIYAYS